MFAAALETVNGRIRCEQDEGDECARVFIMISWRQPLLALSFSGHSIPPLDPLTSETSPSREGGSRAEWGCGGADLRMKNKGWEIARRIETKCGLEHHFGTMLNKD
jgi:hypothetical protein